MWWLLLAGLVGAAVITLVVCGWITRQKIREVLAERGIKRALVNAANSCTNVVTLTDLENRNTIEIKGDGISYDVRENDIITTTY